MFGIAFVGMSGFYPKESFALAAEIDSSSSAKFKQLRFSFAVKNTSNLELYNQSLWIYMPANSNQQHLKNLKSSVDYDLVADELNQNCMKFEFSSIAPLSTKLISVTAQVSKLSESKIDAIEPAAWKLSERLLESDDLQIKLLAQQLKQGDDASTCFAIYKWVSENIRYSTYHADDLGALYALRQLKGDCTEYACLAVALARANGIPARMVGGYVSDKDAVVKAKDYHHWSEVYFDRQWRILDAQKKSWLDMNADYVAFNYYQTLQQTAIASGNRYKLSDGLELIY